MSEGNAVEVIRLVCYFVTPFTFPSTEYCDLALYRFKRQENKDVLCSLKKKLSSFKNIKLAAFDLLLSFLFMLSLSNPRLSITSVIREHV